MMKISELIEKLKEIAANEGEDLPVYVKDFEYGLNDNIYMEVVDADISNHQDKSKIERRLVIE